MHKIKNTLKYITILILLIIISSCKTKETHEINLKGNWYMGYFFNPPIDSINFKSEINFGYDEIFLTDKKIFSYSNITGFNAPDEYFIKQDSLFISFLTGYDDFKFRAKIKIIDDNKFILTDSLNQKGVFCRIINEKNTLDKFISFESKYPEFHQKKQEYTQGFLDRSYIYYEKIKSKK